MKRVIASVGLVAIGAVGIQSAEAQIAPGPGKSWSVSGKLRGFYDDNINTVPDGPGKEHSYGVEVSPGADVSLTWGSSSLKASYYYSMLYYTALRFADQDHDFELDFKHAFNERYSAEVRDSFVIAQEPDMIASGGNGLTPGTPLRSDGSNLRNSGDISFKGQFTPLVGLNANYNNTLYDFSENAGNTVTPGVPSRSAILDRDEHLLTLDSTWLIQDQTTGIIGYQFGLVDHTSSESIVNAGDPFVSSSALDQYSHYFYVGADHKFRSDLSANFRVGIQYVDYYNALPGSSSSATSPYATLGLNYSYAYGGLLTFGFTHEHNQTDVTGTSIIVNGVTTANLTSDQESSSGFLTVSQQLAFLSPRLTATANGAYQNSVFHGGGVDGESDNIFLLGLNLSYQFTKLISSEVGYNYDFLTSDISGRGYHRNRVYLGATATY